MHSVAEILTKPARVLVAEDSSIRRDVPQSSLAQQGYEAETSTNTSFMSFGPIILLF